MSKQKLSLSGKLLPPGNNLCRGKRHLCFSLELGTDSALNGAAGHASSPSLGFYYLLRAVLLSPKWVTVPPSLGVAVIFYKQAHPEGVTACSRISRAAPTLWLPATLTTAHRNPNFLFVPIHHPHPALSTFTP